jgi:hypothetical protein
MRNYFDIHNKGSLYDLFYTSVFWNLRDDLELIEYSHLEYYSTNYDSTTEFIALERFGFRNSRYLK